MAPKVFVSHASEDKERFVLRFAEGLRAKGIEAWVDRWEILPGDSLIQRIFEEGIKQSSAVVVVLSTFSVSKPWVKEELDAAAVKRINDGSKLIPVVIDDCEVPQVLQATAWLRVRDLADIDGAVEIVTRAVFDHREKPQIGPPPTYAADTYRSLPDLSATEAYVLIEAAKWTIDNDEYIIDPTKMFLGGATNEIQPDALGDLIEYLDQMGYVKAHKHLGRGPYQFRVTPEGIEVYLANLFPDYDAVIARTIGILVNENVTLAREIAKRLDVPHRVIKHVFQRLEADDHVLLSKSLGSDSHAVLVKPSLEAVARQVTSFFRHSLLVLATAAIGVIVEKTLMKSLQNQIVMITLKF